LAFGDMLEAVKQAEALAKPEAAGPSKPAAALNVTQDRIIDVLQRLLNEVRRETADAMTQTDRKPSNELPPDVKSKLAKLDDKLKELVKQQKKVIEATQALAKVPVEDFTEKEKQLLKDLAATEDDWSRFLADLHSDLSKLPEQDFSNPSLLQEMVEVQTQLKMAEDALTKKSADIAVPLEQLGAEMAKELSTNIEKWLPDTPDRERWSQEEPLTDDMKAAPMAELPGELEDIIGDLMEQEEDLFDEMEDVSSSWADSIDKGAGWDAMDGPISNNSAKGVTGNRLPNTSEVAGRSGEGRSGKSSGEFVGDSAVGKGGRKTPTRLTPDAHVKGQVKDHSKDPSGGATGGGKESGAGGEGLQGPVPDRPERMMERLATRQAELRNKAESVDLQFQVHNYHHTDLRKMIDTMSGVENDLRAGRYHNALRRREVLLDGLGQVKTYVKGEFSVRQDKTVNLPTDIQKEILGTMQEASPAGWEGLNRQYFERLAAPGPSRRIRTRSSVGRLRLRNRSCEAASGKRVVDTVSKPQAAVGTDSQDSVRRYPPCATHSHPPSCAAWPSRPSSRPASRRRPLSPSISSRSSTTAATDAPSATCSGRSCSARAASSSPSRCRTCATGASARKRSPPPIPRWRR